MVKERLKIDALALKRKLSKRFSERFGREDGTIDFDKLQAEEERLKKKYRTGENWPTDKNGDQGV